MNNIIIGAIVAIVLVIGGVLFINNKSNPAQTEAAATAVPNTENAVAPLATATTEPVKVDSLQIKPAAAPQPAITEPTIEINGKEQAEITYPQTTITLTWAAPAGSPCKLIGYFGDSPTGPIESKAVDAGSGQMEVKLLDPATGYGLHQGGVETYMLSCTDGSTALASLKLNRWPK